MLWLLDLINKQFQSLTINPCNLCNPWRPSQDYKALSYCRNNNNIISFNHNKHTAGIADINNIKNLELNKKNELREGFIKKKKKIREFSLSSEGPPSPSKIREKILFFI